MGGWGPSAEKDVGPDFDAGRCNLKNDLLDSSMKCNILDAMVLKRVLETTATLPSVPPCAAANPPLP